MCNATVCMLSFAKMLRETVWVENSFAPWTRDLCHVHGLGDFQNVVEWSMHTAQRMAPIIISVSKMDFGYKRATYPRTESPSPNPVITRH